jgi:hypothetical protein
MKIKYRTLLIGEIIQKGDEFFELGKWFKSKLGGYNILVNEKHSLYRRQIINKGHPHTNIFK